MKSSKARIQVVLKSILSIQKEKREEETKYNIE